MNYKWGKSVFHTLDDMLQGIIYDFFKEIGTHKEVLALLDEKTDDALADELIETWGLDQPQENDERPSHMEQYGYTREDLSITLAEIRKTYYENCSLNERSDEDFKLKN